MAKYLESIFLLIAFAGFAVGETTNNTALVDQAQLQVPYSESISYAPRTLPTPKPGSKLEKVISKKNQAQVASPVIGDLTGVATKTVDPKVITLPVTLIDESGKFVEGLRATDFAVFIDNKAANIGSVTNDSKPFTVIIVIDLKAWTSYSLQQLQEASLAITGQFGADDRIMVVGYAKEPKIVLEATNDREKVRKAIRGLRLTGKDSAFFDTIQYTFNTVIPLISGKLAVVVISDGYDNLSKNSNYETSVLAVERTDVLVFPVYLDNFEPNYRSLTRGMGTWVNGGISSAIASEVLTPGEEQERVKWQYELGSLYMNDLVFVSGGRAMFTGDFLVEPKKRKYDIGQQLRTQYYLTFRSAGGTVGTRKQIRVRVNRPGLAVLTRGSYIIPFDNDPK